MDPSRGAHPQEQQMNQGIQDHWVSATPAEPITAGSGSTETPQESPCPIPGSGSNDFGDQLSGLDAGEPELTAPLAGVLSSSIVAESCTLPIENPAQALMHSTSLLALMNSTVISHNGFLVGFLPSLSSHDSSSERTASTGPSEILFPPFAPATPCKDKRLQDCQPPELVTSIVEGSAEKRSREEIGMMQPSEEHSMGSCSGHGLTKPEAPVTPDKSKTISQDCRTHDMIDLDEQRLLEGYTEGIRILQPPIEEQTTPGPSSQSSKFSSDALSERASSQQLEAEKGDVRGKQGENLNKTPRQKIRKKKHRPKVIQEGKPAKTPKPATPNPATEKQNQIVKKQYVRKRKGLNSSNATLDAIGEMVDPDSASAPTRTVNRQSIGSQPVRRSLNFDSEGRGTDEFQASTLTNEKSQARETSSGTSNSSSTRLTVKLPQGIEVVLENSEAGFAFDLNRSLNQALEEYIRSPESTTPPARPSTRESIRDSEQHATLRGMESVSNPDSLQPAPEDPTTFAQPTRRETIRENLKQIAQKQASSNCQSDAILTVDGIKKIRSKRELSHVDDAQTCYVDAAPRDSNVVRLYKEINHASKCHEMSSPVLNSPKIHKKRRTEKAKGPVYNQDVQCNPTYLTFTDPQRERTLDEVQVSGQMLAFGQIKGTQKKRSDLPVRARTPASIATILERHQLLQTSQHRPQDCMEALLSDLRLKLKTKKRSKKRQVDQVGSKYSNMDKEYGVIACNYSPLKHKPLAGSFEVKNSNHLQSSPIQDCQSSSNIQVSVRARVLSRAIVRYVDPIDDIVQKLKCLNINGGHADTTAQEHNALIRYGGGGMMVPLYPIKKHRPRAKVDLDPETNRVWKLLMGKEARDEADGTDMDKEKWWEEQRRVFSGRVDSFIARMHLVQGDRRFSQWKGSVVDSVVGVFLTQNVSDNLSSSAFMSLAARFPVQSEGNNREPNAETMSASTEQVNGSIFLTDDDTIRWQEDTSDVAMCDQSTIMAHEAEHIKEKKMADNIISLGSNHRGGMVDYIKDEGLHVHGTELQISHEAQEIRTDNPVTDIRSTSSAETEDRRSLEDADSSQNSIVSNANSLEYLIQAADQVGSSSETNFETDLIFGSKCSGSDSSTSLVECIQIEENTRTQEPNNHDAGRVSSTESRNAIAQCECTDAEERTVLNGPDNVESACSSICTANSNPNHEEHNFRNVLSVPSKCSHFHNSSYSGLLQMEVDVVVGEESGSYLPLAASGVTDANISSLTRTEAAGHQKLTTATNVQVVDSHASINMICQKLVSCSETDACPEKHSCCHNSNSTDKIDVYSSNESSQLQDGHRAQFQQEERKGDSQVENTLQCKMQSMCSDSCGILEVVEAVESNSKTEACSSQEVLLEIAKNASRAKLVKAETEKISFDWDSLRKEACRNGAERERSNGRLDSLDWEAVRSADMDEVSNTIRGRGMNNVLAQRIKDFLDRLVRDHGSIDLEWLRYAPPDKAKEYLLSIRGLGLKSVECVRLLTLNNHAFPVDTNVGRICVRLGWVPLQPLPESLQLHLLELYPIMETIQKYLWPRLCTLDQQTLYELHYQMITFGKVFCTKRRPNCNACPMRGECRHFASEFASARLALPGPENDCDLALNTIPLPQLEGSRLLEERTVSNNCEPIIEEPATPEPECMQNLESDLEDFCSEDPNEIPHIQVNLKGLTQNLLSLMQENNVELQDGDLSRAIVAITTEAASIPMPKLKNVTRLRTEHQVYELPDTHPLLEGVDQRETDDPCPYLLAIWTPGETARSTEPPETCCSSHDTGKLCYNKTCFACNSIREAQAQTVRGTLLIPCRTAMRGSFPLNGTYFQVNEVFADHDSSCNPIYVPSEWIWNLPRRTVYFGTSVPTIFRGLTTESIQHCFWRGYVCVRGFDRTTRGPMPLKERFHCSAYKASKNKKEAAAENNL